MPAAEEDEAPPAWDVASSPDGGGDSLGEGIELLSLSLDSSGTDSDAADGAGAGTGAGTGAAAVGASSALAAAAAAEGGDAVSAPFVVADEDMANADNSDAWTDEGQAGDQRSRVFGCFCTLLKTCTLGFSGDFLNFFEKVFLKEIKGRGIQSDCRGRGSGLLFRGKKGEEKGGEGEGGKEVAARSCENDDFEEGELRSAKEKTENF